MGAPGGVKTTHGTPALRSRRGAKKPDNGHRGPEPYRGFAYQCGSRSGCAGYRATASSTPSAGRGFAFDAATSAEVAWEIEVALRLGKDTDYQSVLPADLWSSHDITFDVRPYVDALLERMLQARVNSLNVSLHHRPLRGHRVAALIDR